MKKCIRKWEAALLSCILAVMLCSCTPSGGEKNAGKQGEEHKNEEQKEEKEKEKEKPGPSIEEQVLYEENGIRITAKELNITADADYPSGVLSLLVENDGTEDIQYETAAVLVNHYELNQYFGGQKVAAGKKANVKISFDKRLMEKTGYDLQEIGEVEAEFRLGKASEVKTGFSSAELSSTGLLSIKTSAYDSVKSRPIEGGAEIYNEAGVRINYLGLKEAPDEYNGFYSFGAELFIENTSDRPVICWIDVKSIDGKEAAAYHSVHVSAGRMAGTSVDFPKDDTGDMDIGSVGEITVTIHISSEEHMTEEGYPDTDIIAGPSDVTFSAK